MRTLLSLLAISLTTTSCDAALLYHAFRFTANDNSDVSSVSDSVSITDALGRTLSFDIDLTISGNNGTPVDTSGGSGISLSPGLNLSFDGNGAGTPDEVTVSLAISNETGVGLRLTDASFRYVDIVTSNPDAGTVTVPSRVVNYTDINDSPADFFGHRPTGDSFVLADGGGISVAAGINLEDVNGQGIPLTTFTQRTTGGVARIRSIVVQLRATPEPSSLLLGFGATAFGLGCFIRNRRKLCEVQSDSEC